jgi:hypothetical protein
MTSKELPLVDSSLLVSECYVAGERIGGIEMIDVVNPVDDSIVGRIRDIAYGASFVGLHRTRQANIWRNNSVAVAKRTNGRRQATARRRCRHHAVEPPQRSDHARDGSYTCGGLRIKLQVRGRKVPVGVGSCRIGRARWRSRRCVLGYYRLIAGNRCGDDAESARAWPHLYGFDRGQARVDGAISFLKVFELSGTLENGCDQGPD